MRDLPGENKKALQYSDEELIELTEIVELGDVKEEALLSAYPREE